MKGATELGLSLRGIFTKTNHLQSELEQKNREMGFLNEPNQEDTYQISPKVVFGFGQKCDACLFGQNAVLNSCFSF